MNEPAAPVFDPGQCVCCLSDRPDPFLSGLLRCPRCGHAWADLHLPPEAFHRLYSETYFKGGEYADYRDEEPALRRNFRLRLRDLVREHPAGGRLWEVGCAYGYFLSEAGGHFEAGGCDISESAVQNACARLGVDARRLDYLSLTAETPFDVVCLWDTVEHLARPDAYLAKAYADLLPGGTLALSTGDIGSWCARLRGARWRLIHPPTHVHYFNRSSLRTLLERLGYTRITFRYHAFWRSLDTTARKLLLERRGNPRWADGCYRVLWRTGLLRGYYPLNLYDLMTVYARKP